MISKAVKELYDILFIKAPIWGIAATVLTLAMFLSVFYLKCKLHAPRKKILAIIEAWYIFVVLIVTVFSRRSSGLYRWDTRLLWIYNKAFHGGNTFLKDRIFQNIFLLSPIGFLTGISRKPNGLYALAKGLIISLTIELLQLVLQRGCFGIDDLILNTVGALLGFAVCRLIYAVKDKL